MPRRDWRFSHHPCKPHAPPNLIRTTALECLNSSPAQSAGEPLCCEGQHKWYRVVLPHRNSTLRCVVPVRGARAAQSHCCVINFFWANAARSMHFCQIAASCLLTLIASVVQSGALVPSVVTYPKPLLQNFVVDILQSYKLHWQQSLKLFCLGSL